MQFPLARVLAVLALFAPLARADHKDARLGFTVQTPHGWTAVPTKLEERWIVGKYVGDKPFFWTDKGTGWTNEHRPDMTAIAFVAEAVKERAKVSQREKKDGTKEVLIEFDSPYKDYKDFLTRRYQGGGWYVSKEEQVKLGDLSATAYEIKVEKLSY